MPVLDVSVGVPENDKIVSVSDSTTVKQLLTDTKVDIRGGTITLNGTKLNPKDLNKTLAELGVSNNDTIYSVRKMSSAV